MIMEISSLEQVHQKKQVKSGYLMHNTYLSSPISGAAPGEGKNVNIAWSSSQYPLGDAEYLAAMRTVVVPLIKVENA